MATFFNQATLSYNGNVVNSNVVSGEILSVLSANKTAIGTGYGESDEITYVINVINSGNSAFNGLTLTDDLGAYLLNGTTLTPLDYVDGSLSYFVNGTLAATPAVTAGPPLTVSGINVPANSNVSIVYKARLNEFAPLEAGSVIVNTATLSGSGITPIEFSATIPVDSFIALSITKALSPSSISQNGSVTYTFVISNNGNRDTVLADNVVVSDIFSPALVPIVNVTVDGTPIALGSGYNYNSATGEFSTVVGALTVPAATYSRDPVTGAVIVSPGSTVLSVTGNVSA